MSPSEALHFGLARCTQRNMLEVFQYPKCGTCRKALKWLDEKGIEYKSVDIASHPPTLAKLKKALKLSKLPVQRLFNTSGQSYRGGGFSAKLKVMSDAEALDELAADGKLIKRPLVFGEDFVLIGFKESEYEEHFG